MGSLVERLREAGAYFGVGLTIVAMIAVSAAGSLLLTLPVSLVSERLWFVVAACYWPVVVGKLATDGHFANLPDAEKRAEVKLLKQERYVASVMSPSVFDRSMNWVVDSVLVPLFLVRMVAAIGVGATIMIHRLFAG